MTSPLRTNVQRLSSETDMQKLQNSMKEAQKTHAELKRSLAEPRRHDLNARTQDLHDRILNGQIRKGFDRDNPKTLPLEFRLNRTIGDLAASQLPGR